MEIVYTPFVHTFNGKGILYNYFVLQQKSSRIHANPPTINGGHMTYKIQTAKKFLIDGKYCKLRDNATTHVFKADGLDIEFFKVAEILPGTNSKVWKTARAMLNNKKDRERVLEYLQTEAVAEVLSKG